MRSYRPYVGGGPSKLSCDGFEETERNIPINTLTLTPRLEKPFENDGPGTRSAKGPRHNNDRVDIMDIQILPTTDEVR